MPEYEIHVAGPIGPVVASCLPEFTITPGTAVTVLSGTVAGPDELRSFVDLLTARGHPPIDIHIDPGDGPDLGRTRPGPGSRSCRMMRPERGPAYRPLNLRTLPVKPQPAPPHREQPET